MKGRVRGGKRWIDEHVADRFVQRAQASGYRSRAAFKLIELDERDRLLRPGQLVVDLGAAPGSWSQVAAERVGARGEVIAIDLLPIDPIPRVAIRRGDFGEDAVLAEVKSLVAGRPVDLVLSDMAPNITGIAATDAARAIGLAELALDFAQQCLKPEGDFVVKVFQGVGFTEFLAQMRRVFRRVEARKPDASRDRSSETFLVGRGLRKDVGTLV